jgi:PAS domain S-box-containing protein
MKEVIHKALDAVYFYLLALRRPRLTGLLHLFFRNYWRGIVLGDVKKGTITYANPVFLESLGWDQATLRSIKFLDLIHPDDIEKTLKEIQRLADGYKTIDFSNRYLTSDGSFVNVSWMCMSVLGWYICETEVYE